MSTIQDLFQQAQMAEAAYANFFDNTGNLITTNVGVRTALQNDGMSEEQATAFALEWEVVSQILDTESGFSGTVFKNKTSGQYSLALSNQRGQARIISMPTNKSKLAALITKPTGEQ